MVRGRVRTVHDRQPARDLTYGSTVTTQGSVRSPRHERQDRDHHRQPALAIEIRRPSAWRSRRSSPSPPRRRSLQPDWVRLRARDGGGQAVTPAELFFDLVYVFAVTQLSGLIRHDLSARGVLHAAFLLLVVWWAWIYTTWMVNWFDPASPGVLAVLAAAMFASLLMAAALPQAFGARGLLFAASYVALQVGRNAAVVRLLPGEHPLHDVFERVTAWSVASGALWLAGGALAHDQRVILWVAALAVELAAPAAGYWLPNRGRNATSDYDIEGVHFVERCQLFVLIALGESIVVTGASAGSAGLTFTVVVCLAVAFVEMAALWWLYFGGHSERARDAMTV